MANIQAEKLPHTPLSTDINAIRELISYHLSYSVAKAPVTVNERDWFNILAHSLRDYLTERWMETTKRHYEQDTRRVYYMSMEFLMGRALNNTLLNLGLAENFRPVLQELGLTEDIINRIEADPALGNGGLGRLAACFLDSMATLDLAGYGYGIRYEYGMFYQRMKDGAQVEQPDNWLRYGNPWEFPRAELLYPIQYGGRVVEYRNARGQLCHDWTDTEEIMAMAYDTPIPGYGGHTVNTLRLWSAKSSRIFDLQCFNQGEYLKAVEAKERSETLSKVLYPDDTTEKGRELRLRQEYFFVSASLQDILRRYLSIHNDIRGLPEKVAIQLNDTHPALSVPELMRLLLDRHYLDWKTAWDMCVRIFSYTNHTLMPEALETWPLPVLGNLLPRHLQIIYEINWQFLQEVRHLYPGDNELLRRISIIDESGEKRVRMGHLAFVASHRVNGVAVLHTELMKRTIFADFAQLYPDRIVNKTNGITPRRWLNEANPALTALLNQHVNPKWITQLELLEQLVPLAETASFRQAFYEVKQINKQRLATYVKDTLKLELDPDSLFDVHVKRIHEYKRQLLNVLHVITRYNRIRANPTAPVLKRTVIFAGKSAPGYAQAKRIIKLINDVADVINHDPVVAGRLTVVFIPNYEVSNAQRIIPAADLSEQISAAGTEASGTGNMKLALNGALTIGTLDGANIEIREQVGAENFFLFGLTSNEVMQLRQTGYNPWDYYHSNAELRQALDLINSDYFSPGHPERFRPLFDSLTQGGDQYVLLADYAAYIACQAQVDQLYQQPDAWTRKAILNVAHMGYFSTDRTIREYAKEIWQLSASR